MTRFTDVLLAIKCGTRKVLRIYRGAELIWENQRN